MTPFDWGKARYRYGNRHPSSPAPILSGLALPGGLVSRRVRAAREGRAGRHDDDDDDEGYLIPTHSLTESWVILHTDICEMHTQAVDFLYAVEPSQ